MHFMHCTVCIKRLTWFFSLQKRVHCILCVYMATMSVQDIYLSITPIQISQIKMENIHFISEYIFKTINPRNMLQGMYRFIN